MPTSQNPFAPASGAVHCLVPMVHVADVDRSILFYSGLGFSLRGRMQLDSGVVNWAAMGNERAEIMFARASGPIVPSQQAILLYLYSLDLPALRAHLLQLGATDGGDYCAEQPPSGGPWNSTHPRGIVSTISFPFYMEAGEIRVHDPDGYCLLIGQLDKR